MASAGTKHNKYGITRPQLKGYGNPKLECVFVGSVMSDTVLDAGQADHWSRVTDTHVPRPICINNALGTWIWSKAVCLHRAKEFLI